MNWLLSKATIVGRDHEFSKKNRQDFVHSLQTGDLSIGVVCDGCGESKYSEVGASLTGIYFLNYWRRYAGIHFSSYKEVSVEALASLKQSLEVGFTDFLLSLQHNLLFPNISAEKISFVDEFMLCTCLFSVIINDMIIVGHCGDGVIILNGERSSIDQEGRPEYIAYRSIPKEVLQTRPTALDFFQINVYPQESLDSVIIGTDGIEPLLDKGYLSDLYGTRKRQLQRKFNLWQEQKIFGDDATCIVIEKQNGD